MRFDATGVEATRADVQASPRGIAVQVSGLSKAYRIYEHPRDRLKQLFSLSGRRHYQEFWALRDVSFDVHDGEALGIIGRNGHGKSTLLQLLAGTLTPSEGLVDVRGRVAALLELGSGFNPEFTGRENVLFGGMLLGMARAQIESRLADVIDFAEIGDFIDHPVKSYSTGMFVRLAFALQIHTDPDVLIVDEALAVGDIFFQQKCFERIRAMRERGLTLVFVSHDMTAVRNLCDRVIVLDRGRVAFEGPPDEAVSRFHDVGRGVLRAPERQGDEHVHAVAPALRAEIVRHDILRHARSRHGAGGLRILAAAFENDANEHDFSVTMQASAQIHLLLHAETAVDAPAVGLHLFDRMNTLVFAAGSRQRGVRLPPLRAGDELIVTLTLGLSVQPGEYTFSLGCSEPSAEGPNFGINLDRHEGLGPIVVHTDTSRVLPFYGVAELPLGIHVEPPLSSGASQAQST
jgi:ABC-type polysaccharide/polyol phosphate transport system ATPase subunit